MSIRNEELGVRNYFGDVTLKIFSAQQRLEAILCLK